MINKVWRSTILNNIQSWAQTLGSSHQTLCSHLKNVFFFGKSCNSVLGAGLEHWRGMWGGDILAPPGRFLSPLRLLFWANFFHSTLTLGSKRHPVSGEDPFFGGGERRILGENDTLFMVKIFLFLFWRTLVVSIVFRRRTVFRGATRLWCLQSCPPCPKIFPEEPYFAWQPLVLPPPPLS